MKKIKEYLDSNELEFNYKNKKLYIINYDEIILLTDSNIILLKDQKTISIKGTNLYFLKLLEKELLNQGIIKVIEL